MDSDIVELGIQQKKRRILSITTQQAWDRLESKKTGLEPREIRNARQVRDACREGVGRRAGRLSQRVHRIRSISNGAAVLFAARLGKTTIENMKDKDFSALAGQIERHIDSFISPTLEDHYKSLEFNSLVSRDGPSLEQTQVETHHQVSEDQTLQQLHNYRRSCNRHAQDPASTQPNILADVRIVSKPIFLLCVGTPSAKDIADDDFLGVPISTSDINVFKKNFLPKSFIVKEIDHMKAILGKRFIRQDGDRRFIHQTVVATLCAREIDGVEAKFQSWTWLLEQIRQGTLLDYVQSKDASDILILLSNTTVDWNDMSISQVYGHLQVLAANHGSLAVCPSWSEAQWTSCKIGDIRKLDMIAQLSDRKYSFRPKTCLGIGRCTLTNQAVDKMVVKRSWSCGAGDVKVVERSKDDNLACYEPGLSPRRVDLSEPIYFHQEYIDSLLTFGEYRIYICQGEIIARAFTGFEWDGKPKDFAAKKIQPTDFSWFSNDSDEQEQKSNELDDFAIYQYSQLLKQFDSQENYRSLRAGVRLDIGVSELNRDGRFFVLEVTRPWEADQMSKLIDDRPHISIPKKLISAIIKEYRPAWRP